jgi:hypothetical protein
MSLVDGRAGRATTVSGNRQRVVDPAPRDDPDRTIDLRDITDARPPVHADDTGHSPIWGAVVAAVVSIPIWVLLVVLVWVLAT